MKNKSAPGATALKPKAQAETHSAKGELDRALEIHVIRIAEESPEARKRKGKEGSPFHRKFIKLLRHTCLSGCGVKQGQKVRLIGSAELVSLVALGIGAAHFEKELGHKRSILSFRQLCVNGELGALSVKKAFSGIKVEFERTAHVIMMLGSAAFEAMLDELHRAYCNESDTPASDASKKRSSRAKRGFNQQEKEKAVMVTFHPAKRSYVTKLRAA